MIRKTEEGFIVVSEAGKKIAGPYKTKQEAIKRLQQVEGFKRRGTV